MTDLDKINKSILKTEVPQLLMISEESLNDEYAYFPYADPKISLLGYPPKKTLGDTPFSITALSDGNLSGALGNRVVMYSFDGINFKEMNSETSIKIKEGETVSFVGNNADYRECVFSSTGKFNVFGNISSLVSDLASANFSQLFKDSSTINSAENLIIPDAEYTVEQNYEGLFFGSSLKIATKILYPKTMTRRIFYRMFMDCENLINAPILPATDLSSGEGCYSRMFYNCTSLITPPELPATTLSEYAYNEMFTGCTSIIESPKLPVKIITKAACINMFSGCTNINYIKAMFTTTPSITYTRNWVYGVASNGTFVKNSAAQWNVSGVNGIPNNWTVETA